jgi:hypothetical protein
MTTTHIAGAVIVIDGRSIQRCPVCGFKLCDSLNVGAPLNPDGTQQTYCCFEVGKLVQVEEGNPTRYSVIEYEEFHLPVDSCISLVE